MSYVFPDRSAVDLSWAGVSAYTPPARDAVELRFAPDVPTASGFCSTAFGTPSAQYNQVGAAGGWATASFGTPLLRMTCTAQGWDASPTFGDVQSFLVGGFIHGGINSTRFGQPSAFEVHPAVSLGVVTQFGLPSAPQDVTALAAGFRVTRFGSHIGYELPTSAEPQVATASGWRSTTFGSAALANQASGWLSGAAFGQASSRLSLSAAGTAFGSFGVPGLRISARAQGFQAIRIGTPTVLRRQPAAGTSTTRFGTPRVEISNAYPARTLGSTARFGRPSGRHLNAYPAAGFTGTQFGEPACSQSYRARHIAPSIRFGLPSREINAPC